MSTSSMNEPAKMLNLAAPAATGKAAHTVATLTTEYYPLGGDCPGNNLGGSMTGTVAQCESACNSDSACKGFSVPSGGNSCILKTATCSVYDANGWTFYSSAEPYHSGSGPRPFYGSFSWEEESAYNKMNGYLCYDTKPHTLHLVDSASKCEAICNLDGDTCRGYSISNFPTHHDGKFECITNANVCTNPTPQPSYSFYSKNGDGSGKVGVCSCVGPDDPFLSECKLAACFNRPSFAGHYNTGQNFGFSGTCDQIKAGSSGSSLNPVNCDEKYGVMEDAVCMNNNFKGLEWGTAVTCSCPTGDDNIALSPCCLSGCLNQQGPTTMRNAGQRWGWEGACDSTNGPSVENCNCETLYYDVIGCTCSQKPNHPAAHNSM